MLTGLSIEGFRGIEQLTIRPLGRINLVAGKNGAGKTAVLESLWILSGPDMPDLAVRLDAFRGLPPPSAETAFVDLFNRFNTRESIKIVGEVKSRLKHRKLMIHLEDHLSSTARLPQYGNPSEAALERSTQLQTEGQYEIVLDYQHDDGKAYKSRAWWVEQTLSPPPQIPVQIALTNASVRQEREQVPGRPVSTFMGALHRNNLEEDARMFGALQLQGEDGEILAILRTLEPRLKSITPILINNIPVIHANIGVDRPIASRLLGEGFNRMFSMAVAMQTTRGGMLLIDEIENGLHHSVMKDVFSNLLVLANKFDVQVVATTHSAECIKAAYESLSHGNAEDFTFHRIDRVEGHSKATYFDGEMLETAMLHEMEVR